MILRKPLNTLLPVQAFTRVTTSDVNREPHVIITEQLVNKL